MKFTSGPWKLNDTASGHYDAPRVLSYGDPDNPQLIAEIVVSNLWEQNGNLIAAAPELYAALKGWQEHLAESFDCMDAKEQSIYFAAKAALAKADGGAHGLNY
jgi:hypothetical protein